MQHCLRGLDIPDFLSYFNKGNNFCDFLFAFQHTEFLFEKGSSLNGKNLFQIGANSYLLETNLCRMTAN